MRSRLGQSRAWYLIAALATLMAGLVSRSLGLDKSHFIVMYVGDVLWAGLIYYLLRWIQPKLRARTSALLAAAFCLAIELQQLSQAGWLLELRSNKMMALVLGHSYSSADLLCYATGIVLALLLDNFCRQKKHPLA